MKKGSGWPKASAEKGELLAGLVADRKVERKVMFGAPVYFVNGNMWTGVFGEQIFLRLSPEDRSELSGKFGASSFEPVKGRKMAEYMTAPDKVVGDRKALGSWLDRSFAYTQTLKKKEK